MVDSVVTWAREYKVDGFRFDLMGHHSLDNMLAVREALDELTVKHDGVDGKRIYVYGEGWDFGEVAGGARFTQARQLELAGTGIGSFSDRLRDAVRGGGPFDADPRIQGFATGLYTDPNGAAVNGTPDEQRARLLLEHDQIKVGLAGRPLHYVINAGLEPEGAERLVEDAIDTMSRATGIKFINDGPTAEAPSQSRAPYQKDVYGERWAPLLIAWTTPEQAPQLKGPVIGTGGSTHFSFGDGPKSFVTGSLELDAPQITEDLRRPAGAAYATAVILHELGHVMGLEHVDDPVQLMYPEIGTPDGLADGDLNGLHELGRAQCRKDLVAGPPSGPAIGRLLARPGRRALPPPCPPGRSGLPSAGPLPGSAAAATPESAAASARAPPAPSG